MGIQPAVIPTLSRIDCINWVIDLLGSARTNFGESQANYAMAVADEAERLFLSRYKGGKDFLTDKQRLNLELLWRVAMISHLQLYNAATFDDIRLRANTEVAGYLPFVNPDTRYPVFERTRNFLIMLGSATNLAKLVALARTYVAIEAIGEDVSQFKSQDILWELAEMLKQLKKVTHWSNYAYNKWNKCKHIVNSWGLQEKLTLNVSNPFLSWNIDFSKEHNDLKQIFEID